VVGSRTTRAGARIGTEAATHLVLLLRPAGLAGPELRLALRNAFDARVSEAGGEEHAVDLIPQDGRSLDVGVHVRLR
jgi:hypothetical protein